MIEYFARDKKKRIVNRRFHDVSAYFARWKAGSGGLARRRKIQLHAYSEWSEARRLTSNLRLGRRATADLPFIIKPLQHGAGISHAATRRMEAQPSPVAHASLVQCCIDGSDWPSARAAHTGQRAYVLGSLRGVRPEGRSSAMRNVVPCVLSAPWAGLLPVPRQARGRRHGDGRRNDPRLKISGIMRS